MSKKIRKSGDPAFYALLEEMGDRHERKSADYGTTRDQLANLRSAEKFGVPAWVGVAIRMGDKDQRIQSFLEKGVLANESLEDSLIDHAVYSILRVLLYREEQARQKTTRINSAPTMDNNDVPDRPYCNICGNPRCDNPNGKH